MKAKTQYYFQWDRNKAQQNEKKHRVRFERAASVFLDPFAISLFDEVHSEDEDRWITMGKDANEVILVVVHTFRERSQNECEIKLISARKATKNEMKHYESDI